MIRNVGAYLYVYMVGLSRKQKTFDAEMCVILLLVVMLDQHLS